MYDRLVVVAQINTAEKFTERIGLDVEESAPYNVEVLTKDALNRMENAPCVIEVPVDEVYVQTQVVKEEKNVKDQLVNKILDILSVQFAREFPKKKK